MPVQHTELVEAMSQGSFYPHRPATVQLIETHISWVFMAGDRVYKVKKPVTFDFLDYGSLDLRRQMCEREVQVNSGLAPRLYRGVVAIREAEAGLSLEGDGPVVAWAVEMNRLPEQRMLHHLLERGEIDNLVLRRIAEALSHFHAGCKTGGDVDSYGAPELIAANIADNFEGTRAHVGSCVGHVEYAHLEGWFQRELRARAGLLKRRVAQGRVRLGHGDLRAEHICVTESGTVLAFDGIEFNDCLRACDVASEIAFLGMDIHSYGYHHFARFLAHTYAHLADDPELMDLLPLYTAYRAHVRAKIDGLRMVQLGAGPEADAARLRAAQHYHLAFAATRQKPMLVMTYGLAGSGKSTLSREVARTLGLHWVRSDVVHKRLQGVRPDERLETGFLSGAYTQQAKQRTYVELLKVATTFLERGEGVIVDASFGYPYMRDPFMEAIQANGWDHLMMQVSVSPEESKRRLDKRAAEGTDPSDATYEIYLRQTEAFVPPTEITRRVHLNGALPAQDQIGVLIEGVLGFDG